MAYNKPKNDKLIDMDKDDEPADDKLVDIEPAENKPSDDRLADEEVQAHVPMPMQQSSAPQVDKEVPPLTDNVANKG